MEKFTVNDFRKFIHKHDTYGSIVLNLSEENIKKAVDEYYQEESDILYGEYEKGDKGEGLPL